MIVLTYLLGFIAMVGISVLAAVIVTNWDKIMSVLCVLIIAGALIVAPYKIGTALIEAVR